MTATATKPNVMLERKALLAQIADVGRVKAAVVGEWEALRARRRGIAGARTALIAKDAMLDDGADTSELDRELAQIDSELADDGDLRTRLRALDGQAERLKHQTIESVLTRRGEYIAAARATAAAERAAADTARAALEDWSRGPGGERWRVVARQRRAAAGGGSAVLGSNLNPPHRRVPEHVDRNARDADANDEQPAVRGTVSRDQPGVQLLGRRPRAAARDRASRCATNDGRRLP